MKQIVIIIIIYTLLLASNLTFGQFNTPIVIDSVNLEHIIDINIIDLDNNNQKDIVVSYRYNSILWYKNTNLNFTEMTAITDSMDKPVYIDHVDIDGNGFEDLLVSNTSNLAKIHLFKNMGGGTLWNETIIDDSIPGAVVRSMFADLDNDGDLDIISCHDIEVAIYTNTSGIFSSKISVANGSEYYNIVVEDYNNDGYKDFVVHSAFGVQLYTNNQNLTFTSQTHSLELQGLLETCDIDNDGDFDIFYQDNSTSTNVKTFKNDSLGNFNLFQSTHFMVGSVQNPSLNFLKLDADSYLDALYTPIVPKEIHYRSNDGTGNLGTPILIDSTYEYSYVIGGDLDNDSDNDIIWYAHSNFGTKRIGIIENKLMSLSVLESENPKFKLFPNPLTDNLNIINLSNSENMKIKIVDIHGKVIYQNNNVPNSINTSNWSNGLYFVQINNITHKIIKVD